MLQGIVLRLGLKALAPFIVPAVLALLSIGGGVSAWWVGWIDWPTLGLGLLVLGLLIVLTEVENKLHKFAIIVLLTGLAYVKGRVDDHDELTQKYEVKILKLEEDQAKEIMKIRTSFIEAHKEEKARQEAIVKSALEEADKLKQDRTTEVLSLRSELQKIRKEAENAQNAKRPALDADSVRRINRMRVYGRVK